MTSYQQNGWHLRDELERARRDGIVEACLLAETRAGLPRGLLVAIASRETELRPAAEDESLPTVEDAARVLAANFAYGRAKGLSGRRLLKFAAAAYDAGPVGAWKALQLTGDPDSGTTGRNYGADVLDRLRAVESALEAGWSPARRPMLQLGDLGPDVLELKRDLREWFEEHAGSVRHTYRMSTSFGPSLKTAVEAFQRANGLEVDGVAGPDTWEALDGVARLH
jgi:peptidoglycan hydrolase-like protein with peptidoglycan-binding domain